MGLNTLKTVKPQLRKPPVEIDISDFVDGKNATLKFNEPRASELYPDNTVLSELKIKFPEMPQPMIYQINLLGKCYELDAEDFDTNDELNPTFTFGQIARTNRDLFFHILGEFLEAFSGLEIEEKIEEQKNSSTE